MMNNRLNLAKEFLKDSGSMFISIDDNEQARLKILCDEIFGGREFYSESNMAKEKRRVLKIHKILQKNTNISYVIKSRIGI